MHQQVFQQAKVLLGDDAMMSQEFTNPVLKKKSEDIV